MSEFKGTKGKWEVIIPAKSNGFANVENEDGTITCYNGGVTKGGAHPKSLANALLISKSLEMLEFLQSLVSSEMTPLVIRKAAKQLIKEATEI